MALRPPFVPNGGRIVSPNLHARLNLHFIAILLTAFCLIFIAHERHASTELGDNVRARRALSSVAGVAGSASLDWGKTLRRSHAELGWHWRAPHPFGCVEGSAALMPDGETVITVGSVYCAANPNPDASPEDPLSKQGSKPMNVAFHNLPSDTWSRNVSLPRHMHHIFNALFLYDGVLVLVGGVDAAVYSDFRIKPRNHNGLYMLDTRARRGDWSWVSLFSSSLTFSGISQCTSAAVDESVHYCVVGSALSYLDDRQQFIRVDLKHTRSTLEKAIAAGHAFNESHTYADGEEDRPLESAGADWAEQTGLITLLAEPPTRGSHLSVFSKHKKPAIGSKGEQAYEVGYTNGRVKRDVETFDAALPIEYNMVTTRGIFYYDVDSNTWHEDGEIPPHISNKEARALVQLPLDYQPWPELAGSVFMFGGQDTGEYMQLRITSDVLHFSPSDGTWKKVGHLPMKVYGQAAVYLPQSNQVFLTGGVDSTGQPCHRHTYLWDIPSPAEMDAYYELDSQRPWQITISSAHFGVYDVTQKLRQLVESEGIISWPMKDFARKHLNDTIGQFWSSDPTWGHYKMPLILVMVRNSFPITMSCSAYDAICNLTD
jgi:hypothetical protein